VAPLIVEESDPHVDYDRRYVVVLDDYLAGDPRPRSETGSGSGTGGGPGGGGTGGGMGGGSGGMGGGMEGADGGGSGSGGMGEPAARSTGVPRTTASWSTAACRPIREPTASARASASGSGSSTRAARRRSGFASAVTP